MKNLEQLYADLEKYRNFDEDNNAENFLDTADEIILKKDPSSILVLVQYFDDEIEYGWVFVSLSSAIEYYPTEIYVKQLIKCIPMMLIKASIFCDNFFNRIFNAPEYLSIFRTNMHLAPKSSFLELFSIMEEESPHHRELIQELRKELEKN